VKPLARFVDSLRQLQEDAMRTLIIVAACAGLLALSGASEAAQIASSSIFGSIEQFQAECSIVNAGTSAQSVTIKIFDDFGTQFGMQTCDGPLGGGGFCSLVVNIENAEAYACVVTAGSTANLRGSLVLYRRLFDPVFEVFYSDPLRSVPLR
jgi:hypothetical protein